MKGPIFRTQNNLKVQAALFSDRLQVKNLGFNPLNKSDEIKLSDIRQVKFIARGPGEDPRRVSLALRRKAEERPYVVADLDSVEAYRLKEEIERLKAQLSSAEKEKKARHAFTVAGRANQSIAQRETSGVSPKIRRFAGFPRRFGRSF